MDEKRRKRLVALTDMMLEWLADDWDQPAVHEMRRATGGYKEAEHQAFARDARGDLGELRRLLGGMPVEPDAVDHLIQDLDSLRDGQKDELGRLLLMAGNTLAFLRLERSTLRRALQGLVRARNQSVCQAHNKKDEWTAARKALRTGGFDFMKRRSP
jgi:hypothetical protein